MVGYLCYIYKILIVHQNDIGFSHVSIFSQCTNGFLFISVLIYLVEDILCLGIISNSSI